MMFGYPWAWPMMLWMGVGMLFWLIPLGVLLWLLVRWLDRRGASGQTPLTTGTTAQEVLRQRYASGEIDAATYKQMRERLGI